MIILESKQELVGKIAKKRETAYFVSCFLWKEKQNRHLTGRSRSRAGGRAPRAASVKVKVAEPMVILTNKKKSQKTNKKIFFF